MNTIQLSDEKLLNLCTFWGRRTLEARNKFIGLLPEVQKRQLFRKKGFESIFHFAKMLAGVSEEQVRNVLNLEKQFVDKPLLKNLLVSGVVSVNKLVRIASVATPQNEGFWAQQAQVLPKSALETLVKDERQLPGQPKQQVEVIPHPHLNDEVKKKLSQLESRGIDINEIILNALQAREHRIEKQKGEIAEQNAPVISRYIPAAAQRIMKEEYGTKCAVPMCKKPSEEIHHTNRFALSKNHNPYCMAPLCREHHLIAHSIDQKFQTVLIASR